MKNSNANKISLRKRMGFYTAYLFIVVFLFVLIELALRLFDYGINTNMYIPLESDENILIENLQVFDKYFPPNKRIKENKEWKYLRTMFAKEKPKNTLRGFVIGGSAAQGFPFESNQSFSKMVEASIQNSGKYNKVEIYNCGVSAISSYCVQDIAHKLMDYSPDFLILYAGNNEYYGTFGEATYVNYSTRHLFIKLNEFKLFQLLNNMASAVSGGKEDMDATLMAKQLSQNQFPPDPVVDKQVAESFIKNIGKIEEACKRNNVKLIVVEPVSNLIDMPPFAGVKDDLLANEITAYKAAIDALDTAQVSNYYHRFSKSEDKKLAENANIIYLNATASGLLNGSVDISSFIKAKDADVRAFRPRTLTLDHLKNSIKPSEDVSFIHLSDELVNNYGLDILGNKIFVDHLHFNEYGHWLVGKSIAQELAEVLKFNDTEKMKSAAVFQDFRTMIQHLYIMPFYQVKPRIVLGKLFEQPPFSTMPLPYSSDLSTYEIGLSQLDQQLQQKLAEGDLGESIYTTIDHYINAENYDLAYSYLNALIKNHPATWQVHRIYARFAEKFVHLQEEAEREYKQAYILSNKNEQTKNELMNFYQASGQMGKLRLLKKDE